MPIHPTAIVDSAACVDASAEIGAYAVVERGVTIGPQTKLWHHAFVAQGTTLGARVRVHPFAVVGHEPQDVKWAGAPSYTKVGDDTVIRESAEIHRGTLPESTTTIGARVYIMSHAHVGHNCAIDDDAILASGALLAGHVSVGRKAFISGNTSVHQFARIGELVMVRGLNAVTQDVVPFMTCALESVTGPNVIGLRRAGFSPAERAEIRAAHRLLFASGLIFGDAVERLATIVRSDPGRRLLAFAQAPSKRGFTRLRRRARFAGDSGPAPDAALE